MSKFSREQKPNMWWVLLLAPCGGLLLGHVFNRAAPALTAASSFFWDQLLWVVITTLAMGTAYLAAAPQLQPIRKKQRRRQADKADK